MTSLKRFLTVTALTLSLACGFAVNAEAKVPSNYSEFKASYDEAAKTPEGAVKLWFEAVLLYYNRSTRHIGKEALLNIVYDIPSDFEKKSTYTTFVKRADEKPYIMRSYCAGATPDNAYKAEIDACELTIVKSEASAYEEDTWYVQVKSNGADSPRKITLKLEDGLWKVSSFGSIYSDVRAPKAPKK